MADHGSELREPEALSDLVRLLDLFAKVVGAESEMPFRARPQCCHSVATC